MYVGGRVDTIGTKNSSLCVLTSWFKYAVTNVDVNHSAHQNRLLARCEEEEGKSVWTYRWRENEHARGKKASAHSQFSLEYGVGVKMYRLLSKLRL